MKFKEYLNKQYILENKNDPLVKYAIEKYPDIFITVDKLNIGRNENQAYYYISTGRKGVYYTLRMRFLETVYGKDPVTGAGYSQGARERDYLVMTLGPNPEKAIERIVKEKPKHGYKKVHVSAINLKPKMKDRPPDEIKFGKYQGQSVHQIAEEDPEYIFWMYTQPWIESKYKTFIPHLRQASQNPKVAQLIQQWEKEKKEKEKKEIELEKKKKSRIKDFEDVIYTLKGVSGDFAHSMARKLESGEDPAEDWTQRMIDITMDVYAKQFGRRNSKDYNKAYDFIGDLIYDGED